ncbi:MAG: hypothetical protein GC134_10000 [Proteobacteria bacterium]|nr:hypothetical protein [Pseudomonadota bacterium]
MSEKNLLTVAFALFAAVLFTLAPDMAHAAGNTTAGQGVLTSIEGLLTGSVGTVVGLGISLFGLWIWLAQQSSWGLLVVIGGAAITAFPGLYGSLAGSFKNAFQGAGATATSAKPTQ